MSVYEDDLLKAALVDIDFLNDVDEENGKVKDSSIGKTKINYLKQILESYLYQIRMGNNNIDTDRLFKLLLLYQNYLQFESFNSKNNITPLDLSRIIRQENIQILECQQYRISSDLNTLNSTFLKILGQKDKEIAELKEAIKDKDGIIKKLFDKI